MNSDYRDKQVVIIGAGSTGRSLANFFITRGARVTLSDKRPAERFDDLDALLRLGVRLDLGGHTQELFTSADLIAVSPGVSLEIPVLKACQEKEIAILGEIEIAWHELSGIMIAITGTNGKSTVTSLIGDMLKAWGQNAFVGGNLGIPLIEAVGKDYDWQVVELSSFQLETIADFRPRYALMLNVTEDHLDRYPDMAHYVAAKQRIFENQQAADFAILNHDDPLVLDCAATIRSRRVYFSSQSVLEEGMSLVDDKILWRWGGQETLFPVSEVPLRGRHNQENIMAAMIPVLIEGCPAEIAWGAVKRFTGLRHRMELLGDLNGAAWYNDSKGTNIGSVVKSLAGLERPVILIAGGKDKQGDLSALIEPIREKVTHLILIGSAADRMAGAFAGLTRIHHADSMHAAVGLAAHYSSPGATVILSPGCSSFDMFESYAARGDIFAREFRDLSAHGECINGS